MKALRRTAVALAVATLGAALGAGAADATPPLKPTVGTAVASDTSKPLRDVVPVVAQREPWVNKRPSQPGPVDDGTYQADEALQTAPAVTAAPSPAFTFEGPSNADNFNAFGFRVNPPDPVGDVGMQHYVAMTNLTFAIYTKTGTPLYGPADTGTLWQGFPIDDCTDPSGDPIVLYDEISNRWILSQFTTRGFDDPTGQAPFYNCVAISTTQDPLGSYYRYAFETDNYFPDYPKYGLMPDALYITTREFGPTDEYRIGVYAIRRQQLLEGNPKPITVSFYLTDGVDPLYLLGDGILPADFDGQQLPPPKSPGYFVGSMDDGARYGAPFDALNVFQARVDWSKPENSTFGLTKQLPIAGFDTIFPCSPTSRDCLPQPGITDRARYLDILSYRQRPTWRLQYRNFRTHETLVTNQSVEARPGVAGVRWWELRNLGDPAVYQEGTWSPDGVNRWMGSVALDKQGNMAAGYSVVDATSVFPGIRYAGRLAGDPLGQLTQGETVLQNGSGVQTTTNSRWGDYTSMNVDPKDGCTFYYINEYYTAAGQASSPAGWQTRVGAFKYPGCK